MIIIINIHINKNDEINNGNNNNNNIINKGINIIKVTMS